MRQVSIEDIRSLLLGPHPDPIEVGLCLRDLTQEYLDQVGYGSLTEMLGVVLTNGVSPDYSTVMRWVRAASVLDGPDDPRREWGLSKLVEVERLSTSQREEFLRKHDPATMTVRQLAAAIRAGTNTGRISPEIDEPHSVLERAIHAYLDRHGISREGIELQISRRRSGDQGHTLTLSSQTMDQDAAEAMAGASRVIGAIARAKAVWRRVTSYRPPKVPKAMSLEDIDALPAGQLEAEWASEDVARISKAGQTILHLPVERVRRTAHEPVWAKGNAKTRDVYGIIDTISQGCLRAATGWPRTDVSCFVESGDQDTSCYANWTRWARQQRAEHGAFDVAANGLTNNLMKIRIPTDGDPGLGRHERDHWRVDAESTDGTLSIALGIFQVWCEANPHDRLFTLCSHAVRPSDEMLCWLGALRNAWVGSTVSGWLSEEELGVRFGAIARFQEFGIPTVIWIVTRPSWDNETVLETALQLATPQQIIEAPHRYGNRDEELPLLGINPLGSCGDRRVDLDGVEYHVEWVKSPHGERPSAILVDEFGREPTTPRHSKCLGCRLLCGVGVLDSPME